MYKVILVLNAGSSSIKFGIFGLDNEKRALYNWMRYRLGSVLLDAALKD
jgi:acetate kinase